MKTLLSPQGFFNYFVGRYQFYWFAAAIAAGTAAINAGTAIASAVSQEDAAGAANAASGKLTAQEIALAKQARDRANAFQQPYYSVGTNANDRLAYLLGTSNTVERPNDLSFSAYMSELKAYQNDLMANRPSQKNKKAFAEWKRKTDKAKESLKKADPNSQGYQNWQAKRPASTSQQLPIDSSFGSLLKDFGKEDFVADPGYQFRVETGNRDLATRLAAMFLTNSGEALKKGMEYNQGLADQTYNDAFNRFNLNKSNKFNMLSGAASSGQNAANVMSGNERVYGDQVTGATARQNQSTQENIIGAGNARSAGYTAAGNALSNAANNYLAYKGRQAGGGSF